MFIPGEYIISADTAIIGIAAALAVALAHTRERVAKLEGRFDEHLRQGDDGDAAGS